MGGGPDNPFLGRLGALSGTAPRPYFPFVGVSLHLDALYYRHFRLRNPAGYPFIMRRLPFALSFYYPGGFSDHLFWGVRPAFVARAAGMGAA